MTNEEIQIAIAKECGWYQIEKGQWLGLSGFCRDKDRESLPDYHNDLNSMHEAEKTLNDTEHKQFRTQLGFLTDQTGDADLCNRKYVSATAPQRAESFLRIKGKWRTE